MKISYDRATIEAICLHKVGNKAISEGITLSQRPLVLNQELKEILFNYFIGSFQPEELYTFYHNQQLTQNTVYQECQYIFSTPQELYEPSVRLAQYLYQQSTHPNIKSGEFYVVYFKNCYIDHEPVDAIGLFKSENKETFIKVYHHGNDFEVKSQRGTNIKKLDKGCLIFNTKAEDGYLLTLVDNTNRKSEAKYWADHFLQVCPHQDDFAQTQQILSLCKNFVSQLPNENGKAEKAHFINRSIDALKEPQIDLNDFAEQVFKKPQLVAEFQQYRKNYQEERNIEINDTLQPAPNALKRTAMGSMTTIKLDRNFDINIHGGEQYLVRGYDPEKKMHYYQLFFKEER